MLVVAPQEYVNIYSTRRVAVSVGSPVRPWCFERFVFLVKTEVNTRHRVPTYSRGHPPTIWWWCKKINRWWCEVMNTEV